MKLKEILIKNFKNIKLIELIANGNNITFEGENGCGKTAALEAILTMLIGQKVMPNDPIMHGEESALLQCKISEGEEVKYKVRVRIGKNVTVNVYAFTPGGLEMDIKSPIKFLSSIVNREVVDPVEFTMKKGTDRIKMLYSLLPGLREAIDKLDEQYVDEQVKRTELNKDRKRIEGELVNTPFTDNLPDTEVDPAELMDDLECAQKHNSGKGEIEKDIASITENITYTKEEVAAAAEEIKALEKHIEEKKGRIQDLENQIDAASDLLVNKQEALDKFNEAPVDEIKEKIANLKDTNAAIRNNIRHVELSKSLDTISLDYSCGLDRMKEIEQEKIEVFKAAEMPVEGLGVGDDDITFPDPNTGEVVKFGSLSTGQQCRVAIPILSKFLPKADQGIRAMVIHDKNALDDKNLKAMLQSADENDIQLVMHQTIKKGKSNEVKIVIDGEDNDSSD